MTITTERGIIHAPQANCDHGNPLIPADLTADGCFDCWIHETHEARMERLELAAEYPYRGPRTMRDMSDNEIESELFERNR